MKLITSILLLVLMPSAASAHQDRILSLRADGVIPELPTLYGATRLHVAHSHSDLSGLRFVSSGHETNLPSCLLRLVSGSTATNLFLVGSWYHDESLLPHYISVEFLETDSVPQLSEKPGVKFLFSLRDAKLLEVTRVVTLQKDGAVRNQKVVLVNGCPE